VAGGAAALALALGGCSSDRSSALPSFEAGTRRIEAVAGTELWAVGGDPGDTLFFLPVDIAASGDLVYVLDRFGNRVSALDAETGEHRWSRGRRGAGPGELASPRALRLTVDDGLAISDGGNPRIARLGADGSPAAPVPLRRSGPAHGVCALREGDWLVATLTPDARLLRLGPGGGVRDTLALPGPYDASAPPLATQVLLAGGGKRPCVLLFGVGAGFAVFGPDGFGDFRLFVEPVTPAPVEVRSSLRRREEHLTDATAAALDAEVVGDELWVLFAGTSEYAGRLIDRYGLASGRYRSSWVLPSRADAFAVDGARLYLLARRNGYPVAVARTRPRADPP
jgi:hypothetical protein